MGMKLTRHGVFRWFAVVPVTVQAALLAAGCASIASTGSPGSPGDNGSSSGNGSNGSTATPRPGAVSGSGTVSAPLTLSVRLVLSSSAIVAGSSVTARLEIDNPTGHAIRVADCNREAFQVLLEGPAYHQGPSWLNCLTEDSIPPGVSVREMRVMAVANGCTSSRPVPEGLVGCAAGGSLPALPLGTYHAHVFAVSPQLPSAPDVIVHVVPAAR